MISLQRFATRAFSVAIECCNVSHRDRMLTLYYYIRLLLLYTSSIFKYNYGNCE